MPRHLRIARPVSDLARTKEMYCRGLGLRVIGSFEDHQGFDGLMLGMPGAEYHFEFTRSRHHPVRPTPTSEDLAVFYIPAHAEWRATCASMLAAGFKQVTAVNPYWEVNGRTYEDGDGYRVVLEQGEWSNAELYAYQPPAVVS
jgi:catechol 2,3-dioxygenase-like lactoylglutathione lyase family enzyme